MREKFVYDAEIGDNTKFVYTPKRNKKRSSHIRSYMKSLW
jgi:hypothetical protein